MISKVDKGVALGGAETLGTGYFPAASARKASFFGPVSTPVKRFYIFPCPVSEGLPAVADCNLWQTLTLFDIRSIIVWQNRKGDWLTIASSREILSAENLSNAQYDPFIHLAYSPLKKHHNLR